MRGFGLHFWLLLFVIVMPMVFAEDQVVINSRDWQDVFSGILYARLKGVEVNYVAEESQGVLLYRDVLDKGAKKVLLIESKARPFIFGYDTQLRNTGFDVEKLVSDDSAKTNMQLAERLVSVGINNFVVIDGNFGYSAISVAPYSMLTKSFVVFIGKQNALSVYDFLNDNAKELLIYGNLDKESKEALASLRGDVIRTGDRYGDNIAITKKFIGKQPSKQVILTNGEFIELGLFNSEFPVLFIGTTNIPDKVIEFIKSSEITVGVVIGYDLYANSKAIRDATGLRIFLKYGQGRNSQMYALDIFPLPSYSPSIGIKTVRYNSISKQLEVVFENLGSIYTYVQTLSHEILVNNESVGAVGDESPFFLDAQETKAVVYSIDLTKYLDDRIFVQSKFAFGETLESLTKLAEKESEVEQVTIVDDSSIKIEGVFFNTKKQRFEVVLANFGKERVFVDVEMTDVIVDDEPVTLGSELASISAGSDKIITIKAGLSEEDVARNSVVRVSARYGEREDGLIKSLSGEFELGLVSSDYKPIVLGVIVVVAILLIVLIMRRRSIHE